MMDQALLPERIFGLAVVDGRRTVRPGAVVRFRFRARNASELATPPAKVSFALPHGWGALDPLEAEIPPVRPGGEHVVWFTARPEIADDTTALSRFQAVLHLDDLVLGSNVVHVRVTGSARFNAPASAVRIEPAAGTRLRVAIDVTNEGDAAAHNVRIVAPPPPGFRADPAATVATTPELAPGMAFAFAYEMEPVAPASPIVRIDDAFVTFDTGRAALSTGAAHVLAPALLVPEVASTRAATRLDTLIRIANDGWVPARDVRVVVELPAGWRILRGTMLADGAPAAIRRDPGAENGVTIALPFVPARGSVAVSVVSSASRPRTDGAIVVRCGAHTVEAPIPEPANRALRLEARPESPFAVPGATIPIAVDAFNNGETVEQLTIELDGEPVWRGEIKPGASAAFVARYVTPGDVRDTDIATLHVTARGADDEALATATIEVRVVDRPWLAIDEVMVEGSDAHVIVRNVGATTARDVRIDGDADVRIAALLPGEIASITLGVGATRSAGVTSAGGTVVPIGWDVQPETIAVEADLAVVPAIRAGQRLDIRLRCVAAGTLETLRVRPRPHSGAVYVAGSTSVNGYAIVDGVDGPPLLLGDGLALYDIPPGTVAEIAWSLLPRTPGDLIVAVDLEANGSPVELAEAHVRISDAVPFGARPNALPFHIDAATVADPAAAPVMLDPPATIPAAVERARTPVAAAPAGAGTFVLQHALDDARVDAIRRVLRGSRGPGLVGHLPAFAVLLPTGIGADPAVNAALATATEAIRGVYERLFVKLRIPGYDVSPFDLEDNAARRELVGFLRSAAAGTAMPPYGSAELRVTVTSSALAAARDALADAPLGGPVTLAAIASLLPRGGDGPLAAIGAYVDVLAVELAATRTLAAGAFTSYVTTHGSASLDTARDAALVALDAPGVLAGG
jgi:hypothetical protein